MNRWRGRDYDEYFDDYSHGYQDEYDDDDDYLDEFGSDCGTDHDTPDDAVIINGPLHARNQRGGFGAQWWGKQFVAALEKMDWDNRLQRGRTYARNGTVQWLEISYGHVLAAVQGSRRTPYCVTLTLHPFSPTGWNRALKKLGGQAIYTAKLLAGELPSALEELFRLNGLWLFPRDNSDLNFECTCPDYASPCKHAAAVYYLLAEQIDADPFLLFHLRGLTREELLDGLRKQRQEAAVQSGPGKPPEVATSVSGDMRSLSLEGFWGSVEPLAAIEDDREWMTPASPPWLKQFGEPPGEISKGLRAIYREVSAAARAWLGLD